MIYCVCSIEHPILSERGGGEEKCVASQQTNPGNDGLLISLWPDVLFSGKRSEKLIKKPGRGADDSFAKQIAGILSQRKDAWQKKEKQQARGVGWRELSVCSESTPMQSRLWLPLILITPAVRKARLLLCLQSLKQTSDDKRLRCESV